MDLETATAQLPPTQRRGKARRLAPVAMLSAGALFTQATCGPDDGNGDASPTPETFDRQVLLAGLASNVILPTYRQFQTAAETLHAATSAYVGALEPADARVGGDAFDMADADAARETARAAWRDAMDVWQQAELFQVGPAGSSIDVMGGQDLRDEIYSWPTVSSCRVDQETVEEQYLSASFFEQELVNVYGLDALEYLLFTDSLENTCPPQTTINSSGAWDALEDAEIVRRRAEYADAVAGRLVESATTLVTAWEPSGGNFAGQLASAGEEGSIYSSAQDALDEVFAAMYYLELDVKDMKLAEPAGISDTCTSTTCPEELESKWADRSKEHILANILGFQKLFLGGDPANAGNPGFDDYLTAVGAGELATTMATDTENALAVVAAIDGSMSQALAEDLESVEAAHAAVKAVTDNLKSQFVTVLSLEVPDEGAGDND